MSFKTRIGRCYELAGRYQSNNGGILVHGSIEGFGNPRLDHAWVVNNDGSVHEAILQEDLEPYIFEQLFNPEENSRYDRFEAALLALKSKHWGPW